MGTTKRIFSVFLALVVMMTAFAGLSVSAAAKSNQWDGYTKISTAKELLKLNNSNGKFYLAKDIDLKSYGDWDEEITFSGTLDGNGFCIKNLTSKKFGLFSELSDATVQNLGITNVKIKSSVMEIGALTRICKNSSISNCYVTGSVENTDEYGTAAGFIGGIFWGNKLTDCANMADIKGYFAYGLSASDSTDVYTSCINYGAIKGGRAAGGICRELGSEMKSCYNFGDVTASEDDGAAGGLAYKANNSAVMSDCSTVTSTDIGERSENCSAKASTGVSASKLKKSSAYKGLDLGKTWTMGKKVNGGYPVLAIMLRDYNGSKPTANKPAGSYKNSVKVTLSTDIEGGVICYTTNGKTPTASSAKYTKPITLKKNTTVKAAVFVNGVRAKVATLKYTITK